MLNRSSFLGALGALVLGSLALTAAAQPKPAPSAGPSASASAGVPPAPPPPGKAPPPPGKAPAPAKGAPGKGKPGAAPPPPPEGQGAPCPPGAICEKTEVRPPDELGNPDEAAAAAEAEARAAAGGTIVTIPPPPPGSDPNAPRVIVVQPSPEGRPGQVVVYEAGTAPPHVPGVSEPIRPIPPPPPPPEPLEWHRERQWGFNLHLGGLLLPGVGIGGHDDHVGGAGLVGLGLGVRFRPVPILAIEVGSDFFAGIDANGYERREIPIALNAIFYFNPDDVVQFYAFGGPEFTFAQVFADKLERNLADGTSDQYDYFGGHVGLGLEFRVSDLVGIAIDGYGLLRTRVDGDGDGLYPEYFDARSGDSSNTSGAAVLRGGVNFWW